MCELGQRWMRRVGGADRRSRKVPGSPSFTSSESARSARQIVERCNHLDELKQDDFKADFPRIAEDQQGATGQPREALRVVGAPAKPDLAHVPRQKVRFAGHRRAQCQNADLPLDQ